MQSIKFFPQNLLDEFTIEEINRLKELDSSGLALDTRSLEKGNFFIGIDGHKTTGSLFLEEAFLKGASGALISQKGFDAIRSQERILKLLPLWISTQNPSFYVGEMASLFYSKAPSRLMAVTGTNGKTSVTFFAHQIMFFLGVSSACLGTTGLWVLENQGAKVGFEESKLTCPDAITLHKTLEKLYLRGIESLALEASSHGLHQNRLKGLNFKAAAFTNFSQDHLDYHQTMDAYFEAKCLLFSEILKKDGWAVLNADIEEIGILTKISERRCHRIFTYGAKGDDVRLLAYEPKLDCLHITVNLWGIVKSLTLPLVGDYQVHNALCALGLVLGALDVTPEDTLILQKALEALEFLQAPPGRLEKVGETKTRARIYVDYAHTPDAYERVLKTLRPFTKGHLWILFGCGGERDAQKRPLMGKMAYTYADFIVITDDNPRSENPAQIRSEILTFLPENKQALPDNIFVIEDREKAIKWTLQHLKEDDVLLLAGKGHETGQIIGNMTYPFNDKNVTLMLLKELEK
ncbi:MAG: UDP-N-acetylmuramoyl-L-alanyl-D-glutamate--2,6-diaminopimelate ligase [Proteobacteria bacterium]|nr:UDP-N-acetylmuramoyl-L-alanyl-D-glutamate--2,6-diaminopimelate ligase [Pseudomonadota bacterium]